VYLLVFFVKLKKRPFIHYGLAAKRRTRDCLYFRSFYCVKFENYDGIFFYEILILIKSININDCCFQIIINKTNLIYLFQRHNNITKKYNLNFYLFNDTNTIIIIENRGFWADFFLFQLYP
jgi:hypothetical protein